MVENWVAVSVELKVGMMGEQWAFDLVQLSE